MFDFLKKILSLKSGNLTVIVWKEETPDETDTYKVKPAGLLVMIVASHLAFLVLVFLFLILTPLGSPLYNLQEREIRQELINLHDRILALRDTLNARDQQLADFKYALAKSIDTTFQVDTELLDQSWIDDLRTSWIVTDPYRDLENGLRFSDHYILFENQNEFRTTLNFPTEFPLSGTITRRFDFESRHLGIDIATAKGELIRSFADGFVLFSGWTINYGYVIALQHNDGFVSFFKHCENVYWKKGDLVKAGDLIGTVGSTGLLTSGPHLHFELWRNGIPRDPSHFFINL